MRYMIILKGDPDPAEVEIRSEEVVQAMRAYSKQLADAGALITAEGLHPSVRAARVQFRGGQQTVIDGPFAESKELIAGYYLIRAASLEEAVRWAGRCPVEDGVIEVREVFDVPD